ncbi:hypothetical protein WME94_09875 [Sorangium sp. So ce429]
MTSNEERTLWLNERGRDGWELVSQTDRSNMVCYTFKHPKETP